MNRTAAIGRHSIPCDQWLQLLDKLNIGALTVDMRRRITAMNPSAKFMMGLQEIDVIGRDCLEVFMGVPCLMKCLPGDEDCPEAEHLAWDNVDGRQARDLVTRVSTPILGAAGVPVGCMTVLQDHSPLADLVNRIHYEERTLKFILDSLDIGIFTVNRGGLITFFNTAAEKISGYDRRQILGRGCATIFGNGMGGESDVLDECMNDGHPRVDRRGGLITPEGEQVPVRVDYLPLQNEFGHIVGGVATLQDLTLLEHLDQVISDRYSFHHMIGKDPAMQRIFDMARLVARSEATVLIEGATGTGKDLLAKVIHSASKRADGPFVKINCAAIPHDLLESEFFGYVRGAFTGAEQDHPGRFRQANGGTLFLDEIGDLPRSMQAKLLRVLEDREFFPLGSHRTVRVDVRIVSATNVGLKERVAKRAFREDLFYRLNVLRIELPPLQDRRSDLPLLIRHILRRLCATRAERPPELSRRAVEILLNYPYPGNVRELENILEHALIVGRSDVIRPVHLPDYVQNRMGNRGPEPETGAAGPVAPAKADDRERILQALSRFQGHRARTARALGIDRTTLWRRMKRYGLLDGAAGKP